MGDGRPKVPWVGYDWQCDKPFLEVLKDEFDIEFFYEDLRNYGGAFRELTKPRNRRLIVVNGKLGYEPQDLPGNLNPSECSVEFIKAIRMITRHRHVPIIVTSLGTSAGYSQDLDYIGAGASEVYDYSDVEGLVEMCVRLANLPLRRRFE